LFEAVPFAAGALALIFALILALRIKGSGRGSEKAVEISDLIYTGAHKYLESQYKVLVVFVAVLAVVLAAIPSIGPATAVAFVMGALFSGVSGNIGMKIATSANSRTAEGCRKGIGPGLSVAFSSGTVMGMTVVGLGILGVAITFMIFPDTGILFGFGFGASSIALFSRVGGGIYTKAADVGADLVGKVEAGIPEDDPRNPAVIADNVGDNVGDVAGMGADLFESYVDSIIAAMAIGVVVFGAQGLWLPLTIAGAGIICSIIGTVFVRTGTGKTPGKALNRGIFSSAVLMAVAAYFVSSWVLGPQNAFGPYISMVAGLAGGVVIGLATEYHTSPHRRPVREIAKSSETGAGTNVITGFAMGMESTIVPVLAVSAVIFAAYSFAGLFGIAIAAVGMLSTLGITLATDTYGPVADNAAGIAEMAGLGKKTRENAECLDAVGNTTAAMGKGFAIGSAALTALALFAVYGESVGVSTIDVMNPVVLIGVFMGGLMPFIFSSLTMRAVGRTAYTMVNEVRRQFRNKDIMKGRKRPDYRKPIAISTHSALREMLIPGCLAVAVPLAVGVLLGAEALGGLLVGSIVTGFLLAVTMSNAGGAWDNAKKYIEEGHLGGKGSQAHKAAVVGDTVGDPFKDTSGPSLNILIKVMSIVALVFAPLFL